MGVGEEESEQIRTSMRNYLGNLMEDASDFSRDLAKMCHAILLTNIEAARMSWIETKKSDRFRRAHAQRLEHKPLTHALLPRNKKKSYSKSIMICKYFQKGS